MKSSFYLTAQIGFTVLALIYFYLLLRQLIEGLNQTAWNESSKARYRKIIIIVPIALAVFVAAWSLSGIMADFSKFPFNFMPVLVIPFVISLVATFDRGFTEILGHIPSWKLLQLQSFRFFVEILLWILFIDSMLPMQMTFEGRNFDILAGVTAPLIAWLTAKQKLSQIVLIGWNILCLGLLINIVTIAILSTPSPIRIFMEEPSNTAVTQFPISLLPGLLVPLAYTLHFFSLRQLLTKRTVLNDRGVRQTVNS